MKTTLSSFLIGVLFALGLGVAGMTQPQKVVSFLDVFGNWDPSLAFVMAGALIVHAISFRLITRRASPLFADEFVVPTRRDIDRPLVLGAFLFGIGWGLAGYCPAPVVTALTTLSVPPIVFFVSMVAGMLLFRVMNASESKRP